MGTKRPFWVRLGLWRLKSRSSALRWMRMSLYLAAAFFFAAMAFITWFELGPLTTAAYAGVVMAAFPVIAALWYWLAIRWIDKKSNWE